MLLITVYAVPFFAGKKRESIGINHHSGKVPQAFCQVQQTCCLLRCLTSDSIISPSHIVPFSVDRVPGGQYIIWTILYVLSHLDKIVPLTSPPPLFHLINTPHFYSCHLHHSHHMWSFTSGYCSGKQSSLNKCILCILISRDETLHCIAAPVCVSYWRFMEFQMIKFPNASLITSPRRHFFNIMFCNNMILFFHPLAQQVVLFHSHI